MNMIFNVVLFVYRNLLIEIFVSKLGILCLYFIRNKLETSLNNFVKMTLFICKKFLYASGSSISNSYISSTYLIILYYSFFFQSIFRSRSVSFFQWLYFFFFAIIIVIIYNQLCCIQFLFIGNWHFITFAHGLLL